MFDKFVFFFRGAGGFKKPDYLLGFLLLSLPQYASQRLNYTVFIYLNSNTNNMRNFEEITEIMIILNV